MNCHEGKFCARPFEWLELHPDGAHLCCPGWLTYPPIKVEGKSLREIWNGPEAKEVRESIIDGSFRFCSKHCPFLWHDYYEDPICHASDVDLSQYEPLPTHVNLCQDRSCNLSCPSCRNEIIVSGSKESDEVLESIERLLESCKSLRYLSITGTGDPFAANSYRNLLRRMKSEDWPDLHIHLHTNAILWTKENWDAMSDISSRVLSTEISIDAATHHTYAINRRGGDFDVLMQNLAFIAGLKANGSLDHITISFVVQSNNFREMPQFVDIAQRFDLNQARFSKLSNWGTYTDEEFKFRNVCDPDHFEHEDMIQIIKSIDTPLAFFGNLLCT